MSESLLSYVLGMREGDSISAMWCMQSKPECTPWIHLSFLEHTKELLLVCVSDAGVATGLVQPGASLQSSAIIDTAKSECNSCVSGRRQSSCTHVGTARTCLHAHMLAHSPLTTPTTISAGAPPSPPHTIAAQVPVARNVSAVCAPCAPCAPVARNASAPCAPCAPCASVAMKLRGALARRGKCRWAQGTLFKHALGHYACHPFTPCDTKHLPRCELRQSTARGAGGGVCRAPGGRKHIA